MPKKLTTEEFIERATKSHGDLYDYSSVNYIGTTSKVKIFCRKHNLFEQDAASHMAGHGCPSCANDIRGNSVALNNEKFIEKAVKVHGDRYDYSKVEYINSSTEVTVCCKTHGDFRKKAKDFLYGEGCLLCNQDKRDKINLEIFLQKAKKTHGDRYSYQEVQYIKKTEKLTILCNSHGKFLQKSHAHLAGQGCPKCAKETQRLAVTKSQKQFIQDCKKVHGSKYSYDKTDYKGSKEIITVLCKKHGEFVLNSSSHLNGQGCPQCTRELNSIHMSKTTSEFIKEAKDIYGDVYSYEKTNYINQSEKVIITCPIHQEWTQKPMYHLRGLGCPRCAMVERNKNKHFLPKTTEQFILDAKKVHGDNYSYGETKYTNSKGKVIIFCRLHGNFETRADGHLARQFCPKCAIKKQSERRIKTTDWFIEKAKEKHKDNYCYNNAEYRNSKEKVKISCTIHGEFEITPNAHLQGQGCKKCSSLGKGGWSRSSYIEKANGKICTFYTIRCFNEDEEFYKIGITINTVRERYSKTKAMPYNYEIISEIYGEAGFIWDLELTEKRKLKKLNYTPVIDFGGSKTECFTDYKI